MSATVQTSLKDQFVNSRNKIKESIEIPILTRCCFCFPLRKGLIAFAYINTTLTVVATCFISLYISLIKDAAEASQDDLATEYIRLILDCIGLLLEFVLSLAFIVALHMKHVLLMKIYLYFEIGYSIIGFFYSLSFLTQETASELFLILFQLVLQVYLAILIWSSIVKMERDGTAKYTRDRDVV